MEMAASISDILIVGSLDLNCEALAVGFAAIADK